MGNNWCFSGRFSIGEILRSRVALTNVTMMAKMLAVVVAGAVGVAGEGIGFGEWVSRGKISESSRRSLQSITCETMI